MSVAASEFSTLRTEIAGCPVVELARRFGTPTFVYDAGKIGQRIDDLRTFDSIRYAQKACSNIAILDFMRRRGVLVDAVSAGEIARARAAGYPTQGSPPPIVYTADIFDRESLEVVVREGIHVNCGSPDMIDQLGERAPGREITLRINPGFGHGHSQKTNTGGEQSKHGIWHEQLADVLRRADHHGLGVTGLHLHIGSGTDLDHLSQVCGAMERLAREVGRSLKTISAGGGLPVPYKAGETYVDLDVYYQLWDATRKRLEDAFGHRIHLEIEPGRYLVAESGFLITEIRAVKQMGAHLFYLVDAGFNNLARPILYGSHHPMSIVPAKVDGGPAAGGDARRPRDVVVGGPLCESGDIFTQSEGGFVCTRSLPAAEVGELLAIENAGAYGFAMSSNYNSKPLAAEVLIRDGAAQLIRERQTSEDILRGERIPPTS
ncbi:MAG TPA: diaminopimelate decarboxylase [Pirellulales bacterium]|nr:diaminopimelate decarboxylase [Pirellulales bacterium]